MKLPTRKRPIVAVRSPAAGFPIADVHTGWHQRRMDTVYVLQHVRSDDEYGDDAKVIGVYRSRGAADAAVSRLRDLPGFLKHPEGFQIDAYPLDQDHWCDGFVTSVEYGE